MSSSSVAPVVAANEIGCDLSFAMYLHNEEDLQMGDITLDELCDGIRARIELLHAATNNKMGEISPMARVLLRLRNARMVQIDDLSYRVILFFLCNPQHRLRFAVAHQAHLDAWLKGEGRLSVYRAQNCMSHAGVRQSAAVLMESLVTQCGRMKVTHELYEQLASRAFPDVDQDAERDAFICNMTDDPNSLLKLGTWIVKMPFEWGTHLLKDRPFIQNGFIYAPESELDAIVGHKSAEVHERNLKQITASAMAGSLHAFYAEKRLHPIYADFRKQFAACFGHSTLGSGIIPPSPVMQQHNSESTVEQRSKLAKLIRALPVCINQLADRALSLKNAAHNKRDDRQSFSEFMLRMDAPRPLLRHMLVEKIKIVYEKDEAEVKSLTEHIGFFERRHDHPPPSTNAQYGNSVFVPKCSYIINGSKAGKPSKLVCPIARELIRNNPSLGNTNDEGAKWKLLQQSLSICSKNWTDQAQGMQRPMPVPTVYQRGPDDYTQSLMRAHEDLATRAASLSLSSSSSTPATNKRKH